MNNSLQGWSSLELLTLKFDEKWTNIVLIEINKWVMDTTMKFTNHGVLTDLPSQIKLIWAIAPRMRKLFKKRNVTIRTQTAAHTAVPQSIKAKIWGRISTWFRITDDGVL